jgi:hypothetical protein
MELRLNVMTVIAKFVLMAVIVLAGTNIVRNVTVSLTSAVGACGAGLRHLL